MYLLNGKLVFLYNFLDLERIRWEGKDALTPGKHTIVFDFKYDGPGFPALWQCQGQPRGPEPRRGRYGRQISVPQVVGVLGRDGLH